MLQVVSDVRSCEVCSSTQSNILASYSHPHWRLAQCTNCDFVFLQKAPSYDDLQGDFAWEKSFAREGKRRAQSPFHALDKLSRFRTYIGRAIDNYGLRRVIGSEGRAIEVGCGSAIYLPPGLEPYGIEISPHLAAVARPKFRARGGDVINAPATTALAGLPAEHFDAVLMRSYLEHETRPRSVLESTFRALKPGGRVYVRVPDYASINRRVMGKDWCGFRFPDHVNYFTGQSLKTLAESCGFVYRRLNRLSIFDDNLIAVLTKAAA